MAALLCAEPWMRAQDGPAPSMFRGDTRISGTSPGLTPDTAPRSILWEYGSGAHFFGPATLTSGGILVGIHSGEILYGLDRDGSELWTREFPESRSAYGYSKPAEASDGAVYYVDADAVVHSIDPETGEDHWTSSRLTGDLEGSSRHTWGPLITATGQILTGAWDSYSHRSIGMLDAEGTILWSRDDLWSVAMAMSPDESEIYTHTSNTRSISVLNPENGQTVRDFELDHPLNQWVVGPDGRIYGWLAAETEDLVCVSPADGQILWSETITGNTHLGYPAIADGVVIIADGDDFVSAFDLDGSPLWKTAIPGDIPYTPGSSAGTKGQFAPLITENNRVLLPTPEEIFALDLHSGNILWQTENQNADHQFTPIPGPDGSGILYCIENHGIYAYGLQPEPIDSGIFKAVEIVWEAENGRAYQVEWTHDIENGPWTPLSEIITARDSGEMNFFDTTRDAPNRYYRVQRF